ncbi:amino acid ABC transporter permease [Candidatus Dependentiae bacterium]
MIDLSLLSKSFPALLAGAITSMQIAAGGCSIGFIFGTLFGLAQSGHNKLLRILVTIYVTIFRGTPMLIQLMIAYFVLPQFGIQVSALWTAIIAIGLNSTAYVSQIIRSGIGSVSVGQLEAAQVLGLTKLQTIRYILLPQAIRVIFPALGNEFITLIKDSSLASLIGVTELAKRGSIIQSQTYDALTVYFGVALVYLLMTGGLSLLLSVVQKRMNQHATA